MTKWRRNILIGTGLLAFLAYIAVSLCSLVSAPASPAFQLTPKWIAGLSTLSLFLSSSAWSIYVWHSSQRASPMFTHRSRRAAAFKCTAATTFPLLTLWFRLMLGAVIKVPIPYLELWFVAMALAWMTTPFTVLGLIYLGAKLEAWFYGKG
jgi:hypothetical protein